MCGIVIGCGKDWSKKRLENYLKIIKHRGPDNTGTYIYEDVFIGHVRLSIIDLQKSSNQPFELDNLILSYNGEMFNYLEEREKLINKGYNFDTNSDTEVVLKLYQEYGLSFVDYINGMFVICIFDKNTNEFFIFRDRFGIKPFYYYKNQNSFIGSSEIKPILLDSNLNKPKWNKTVVASFIRDGIMNYSNETFYENVFQIQPGHFLHLDLKTNEVIERKYYSLEKKINDSSLGENINNVFTDLTTSIKIRMRSDVGFSSAFSGGIDSTLVTRLMQNEIQKPIDVFSMLRKDKDDFDSEYSNKYVKLFDTNRYTRVFPSKNDLLTNLNNTIYHQEEPFNGPSVVLQNLMYKMMSDKNIKVVLEGQGGDEVFMGYERYLFSDNFINFFLKGGFLKIKKRTRLSLKLTLFYWLFFRYSILRKLKNYFVFGRKTSNIFNHYIDSGYLESFERDMIKGDLRINEIAKFQLRSLLNYSDKNSMSYGVEVRLPFLDYKLIENSLNIEKDIMMKDYWGKHILRSYLEKIGLPDFAWRKNKNGFEVSKDIWDINDLYPLKSTVETYFKIEFKTITDIKLKWKIINLRALEKIFNVSI